MGRSYALVLGLLILITSGCTHKHLQLSFQRPKGYPAPHRLVAKEDASWQKKADSAEAIAEAEAKQINVAVQAPAINLAVFKWVAEESLKSAPQVAVASAKHKKPFWKKFF